ncbi:hypothetical protein ACFC1R_24860 [Kitasatospora sp. NPDC056138]|uniref:hypothetical protein n=1 Tax=Kitasatospora sp. NPDC056138 TaxID=3345724 RepID=UPI0035DCBDE0
MMAPTARQLVISPHPDLPLTLREAGEGAAVLNVTPSAPVEEAAPRRQPGRGVERW